MADLLVAGDFGMQAQATAVNAVMNQRNKRGRRPLTPFEQRNIVEGKLNPIYIYNVSPIHEWPRPQGQLGTIFISKRVWDAKVSIPTVIDGVVTRWVRNGLSAEEPFIEGGIEIAQDVCGSSPRYDGTHPNSNLTNYGVFISTKPFDVEYLPEQKRIKLAQAEKTVAAQLFGEYIVPKHQQKDMIQEATGKLLEQLQYRILEADNWHQGGPEQRKFIGPWHRECLKAFNNVTGKKESRPWATISIGDTLEACPFCGSTNKPGMPKCATCKEIINKAAYDALKKEMGV